MATEGIDIVVTKSGADEAAASIAAIGDAGTTAGAGVDAVNASLNFMKDTVAQVVPPIQQMNDAAGQSDTVLRAAQAAADRLGVSLEDYNARTANFISQTNSMNAATENASAGLEKHAEEATSATEAQKGLSETSNTLREALAALGLVLSAEKLVEVTEQYQKTQIQLNSVSATTKDLASNTQALYDISQLTGSSFVANVQSFQKLAIETGALGISQADLLTTIKNVNAVVQESGGTSAEASQAVNLFGRALATGAVQGRQMRTILLQFPQLGQLVASGLHTSTQALVTNSQTATTSSKDFVRAFNDAAQTANVAGKEIELTLGGAITTLGNAILQYIGGVESANGFTQLLSSTITTIARNFSTFASVIEVAITVWASYYATIVLIPGAFNLITASVRALTLAVAANPLGFLIVVLTSVIALVYEFGNSINLTSDGSITLLGAVVGAWNLLKEAIVGVYQYLTTTFGPAFNVIGSIIAFVFNTAIAVVKGFLQALSLVFPTLAPLQTALNALSNPLQSFKTVVVDAMTNATTQLNTTTESSKALGAALGDGSGGSVSGGADKAAASVGKFLDGLVQMNRVNADAIPPFNNLVIAQERAVQAAKDAAAAMKTYDDLVNAAAADAQKFALTTQNAMGQMVTATDAWALRSGDAYNAVANDATKAAQTIETQMGDATKAAQSAASAINSVGGASQQVDTDQNIGAYYKAQGGTDPSIIPNIENLSKLIGTPQATPLLIKISQALAAEPAAAAHVIVQNYPFLGNFLTGAGLPTYRDGGSFDVGGSGGPDSQLVQFMASPDERVSIMTPAQQRAMAGNQTAGGKAIIVNMNVTTPDANSFKRSQNQTLLSLRSKLNNVG